MSTGNQERGNESVHGAPVGGSVPYDSINSPGAYVFEQTGHLLRVPEDSIKPGRSPLMQIDSKEPLRVVKISNNPFITATKARMIASQHDISPNW